MDNDTYKSQFTSDDSSSPVPLILLASDNPRLSGALHQTLQQEGLNVEFAPGYPELEALSLAHQSAIVLLEISEHQSVETAVALALHLKRRNASRFVGYLADPILHNSGLAGDALFPRSPRHLPAALRDHFKTGNERQRDGGT